MARKKGISDWAPIVGIWQVEDERVTYLRPDSRIEFGFGIAITAKPLTNGKVSAKIDFREKPKDNEARIIFGYHPQTRNYFSAGLGGYGNAYVIDEFVSGRGWRAVAAAGSKENLTSSKPYHVEVFIAGQHASLRADGVPVVEASLPRPLQGNQVGLLAVGPGPVTFSSITSIPRPPQAFVVMQYGQPYDAVYAEVIKPVCEEMGLEPLRADDVQKPGIILQDIIRSIVESEVVIAEITPPNPNVFYELGYAHALSKSTILLAERGKELPFDIRSYRCIFYDNTIRGKRDVEAALRKHLGSIVRET